MIQLPALLCWSSGKLPLREGPGCVEQQVWQGRRCLFPAAQTPLAPLLSQQQLRQAGGFPGLPAPSSSLCYQCPPGLPPVTDHTVCLYHDSFSCACLAHRRMRERCSTGARMLLLLQTPTSNCPY